MEEESLPVVEGLPVVEAISEVEVLPEVLAEGFIKEVVLVEALEAEGEPRFIFYSLKLLSLKCFFKNHNDDNCFLASSFLITWF